MDEGLMMKSTGISHDCVCVSVWACVCICLSRHVPIYVCACLRVHMEETILFVLFFLSLHQAYVNLLGNKSVFSFAEPLCSTEINSLISYM